MVSLLSFNSVSMGIETKVVSFEFVWFIHSSDLFLINVCVIVIKVKKPVSKVSVSV